MGLYASVENCVYLYLKKKLRNGEIIEDEDVIVPLSVCEQFTGDGDTEDTVKTTYNSAKKSWESILEVEKKFDKLCKEGRIATPTTMYEGRD